MNPAPFSQAVLWPGTLMGDSTPADFEAFILEDFNVRAQFIGVFETLPTFGEPDTGGRSDLVFAVHEDDIPRFAVKRLVWGMRWVEDVLDNEAHDIGTQTWQTGRPMTSIYRPEIHALRSWK